MLAILGILFAFCALFFWGGGDFLIQRTTRRIGDWETLFIVTLFGTIILTPFVYHQLLYYLTVAGTFSTLSLVSIVSISGALINFEALKKGKIAAVEPILSLEIPTVAFLAFFLINETFNSLELSLILVLMLGLSMVSWKSSHISKKGWVEKGVLLAVIAALFYGAEDFLVGYGARITNPLIINWFISVTLFFYTLGYLAFRKKLGKVVRDVKKLPKLLFWTCFFDNLAWIFFAFATILLPITIAVAVSENYIGVAALLGLFINKERFLTHQKIGLALALASAVVLSLMA